MNPNLEQDKDYPGDIISGEGIILVANNGVFEYYVGPNNVEKIAGLLPNEIYKQITSK